MRGKGALGLEKKRVVRRVNNEEYYHIKKDSFQAVVFSLFIYSISLLVLCLLTNSVGIIVVTILGILGILFILMLLSCS